MLEQAWDDYQSTRLDSFINAIQNKGLVIFAGAGVSVAAPSSCPTWDELKREILNQLMEKLLSTGYMSRKTETIHSEVLGMNFRPESFMMCLTSILEHRALISMIKGLNFSRPNMNHGLVALLSREQIVKAIITTNFEEHFERSLNNLNTPYYRIRDDDEASRWSTVSDNTLPVFKPHGCLSKPSSMRFILNEIQVLSAPKRNLLQHFMSSIPVLIMGYSGNDEDLIPILRESLRINSTRTTIVIYPGSAPSEPIQRWDLDRCEGLEVIVSDPFDVLKLLASRLLSSNSIPAGFMEGFERKDDSKQNWKDNIILEVDHLSPCITAICIAHILTSAGNHRLCLKFTKIARDSYVDSNDPSRLQWWLLLGIEAQAFKDLGKFQDALKNNAERMKLLSEMGLEVIAPRTLLDTIHVHLRHNELEFAQFLFHRLKPLFNHVHNTAPDQASIEETMYLWYSAILKRKQRKLDEAIKLFQKALRITNARHDIWHEGRIQLDLALVKMQQSSYEEAQQQFALAIEKAKLSTDWNTAGKAAKNRGALLSVSDKPQLGRPELLRAIEFFKRGCDPDGVERTSRMLDYSHSDFIREFFGLTSDTC